MNNEPYYNEPGYESRRDPRASTQYNEIIEHETLRCGVCDVLERRICYPDDLFEIIKGNFTEQYEDYLQMCKTKAPKDGQPMTDPHGGNRGNFQFNLILQRLKALNEKA